MTHQNRTFLLAYLLLVALPLFGLAGVLRRERNLTAPISIDGVWKIDANQDQLAGFPCARHVMTQNAAFTISQSGKGFTLKTASTAFVAGSGTIEGNTISGILTSSNTAKEAACGEHSLSFVATIDTTVSPRILQGQLKCPGCSAYAFRAVRDEQPKSKETR